MGSSNLPLFDPRDNGSPFARRDGLAGLTQLSVWLLKLNIWLERIAPGRPDQNGRHERMHRTLKQATAQPPQATARLQQKAFYAFQREYNQERPHEALGYATPADVYFEPGAHGAQPAQWEAMQPQKGRGHHKT